MMAASQGMRNAAAALVGANGGTAVELRLPLPPSAGDIGGELGLRTPAFQARALAPVAWERSARETALLVAAAVFESALGLTEPGAIRTAMQSVDAVLANDEVFDLQGCAPVTVAGNACVYRLSLRLRTTEEV